MTFSPSLVEVSGPESRRNLPRLRRAAFARVARIQGKAMGPARRRTRRRVERGEGNIGNRWRRRRKRREKKTRSSTALQGSVSYVFVRGEGSVGLSCERFGREGKMHGNAWTYLAEPRRDISWRREARTGTTAATVDARSGRAVAVTGAGVMGRGDRAGQMRGRATRVAAPTLIAGSGTKAMAMEVWHRRNGTETTTLHLACVSGFLLDEKNRPGSRHARHVYVVAFSQQ